MQRENNKSKLPASATTPTTPVVFKDSAAVYRSLAAAPAQLDVERTAQGIASKFDKGFSGLVGPQSKGHGEVVWANSKVNEAQSKETKPFPIPLIVANATHNSLFVESNPVSKVIVAVHSLFEQHQVDVEYNDSKFKWKCRCYADNVETRFVSRLFSVPERANYFVLDFQRRSGDAFHFQSIYKAINFKLVKSGFIVPCSETKVLEPPVIRTFKPMALPADFFGDGEDMEEEKDAKEYEPLCKMCLSPYIDVQREGLCALANQLERDAGSRKLLAAFGERLVEAVSLSRDQQVRRLATTALAWLSLESTAQRHIKEKGGLRSLVKVLLEEHELLETRREAGKVLQNIQEWDSELSTIIRRASSNMANQDARLVQVMQSLQMRC